MAFLISDREEKCWIDELSAYASNNINDEVNIKIHLDTVLCNGSTELKDSLWPIDVTDGINSAAMVLGGESFSDDSRIGVRKNK